MGAWIIAVVAGLFTGLLTGAGVGGGTLLVLYLTALAGVEQAVAQGVNLLYFLVSAPAALAGHLRNKLVAVKPGLVAAAVGSLVALTAAWLSRDMEPELLRRAFGVLFLAVGVKELFAREKP